MTADGAPRAPQLLPELARSLRSFGQPVDAATDAAHAAVFVPLLDARARASRCAVPGVLAALRGAGLAARIEAAARASAAEGQGDPARARARVAAAREVLEPLRDALLQLDALAPDAERAGAPSEAWTRWVGQLHHVFSAADAACGKLAGVLAERGGDAPPRRWFERRPEAGR